MKKVMLVLAIICIFTAMQAFAATKGWKMVCKNAKYYTTTLVNPSGTINDDRPIVGTSIYVDNSTGNLMMIYVIQECVYVYE